MKYIQLYQYSEYSKEENYEKTTNRYSRSGICIIFNVLWSWKFTISSLPGLISGGSWLISLGGFILADVGLSLLVITAAAKCEGKLDTVLCRAGNIMAKLIGIASVLCIGPLLAIPRTAATTYEMGISPIIGSTGTLAPVIVSIVFFGLTLFLTIRPSKVVDIIGKILTPALLIALAVLIIIGIISPIGGVSEKALIENSLFAEGVSQGYLTMDALGAAALTTVSNFINK